jgi:hypothetical protein
MTQPNAHSVALVWMNVLQVFYRRELGDRAEPRATTSATSNVKTHRGVWSSTETQ